MNLSGSYLIRISGFLLFVLCGISGIAQSRDDAKYRKESDEVRKEVWAWEKPEFRKRDIPAEYANSSRIVIAHHTELTADSKSKLSYYGLGFGSRKEISIIETVRELVKVNDKSAVDDYSEMTFTRVAKSSGFYTRSKETTFVGVRVFKPNGQVKEINADDIVLTKDESKEKQAKLAIPDLQVGDIIDYFITSSQELTNDYSVKTYSVLLFDDAPVLNYSFHGQLGKKFAIDYRSYNGAPDLQVSKNDDRDIVIDVEKKNIAPFETSLWIAPALQLPLIRMNISLGYRGIGSKYMGTSKPGEVNKDKETDEVMESLSNSFATKFYNNYFMRANRGQFEEIVSDAKRMAKQAGLKYSDMSDEEKAAHLYYTLRFTKILNFDINELKRSVNSGKYAFDGLAFILNCVFKVADLDPTILVSTPKTGFRMKEVMDADDFVTASYLPANKKVFSIETIFDVPFYIPESMDGNKNSSSITLKNRSAVMGASAINKMAEIGPGYSIPATDAASNAHIDQLVLSVTPGQDNLGVQRKSIIKGHYKSSLQRDLVLYEDYYEAERKAMGEEMGLIATLEDNKKSRKYVDEVKSAFEEARKKQKDAFVDEAKGWFEVDINDLKDYKIDNLGVRHSSPDFVYSSSFNMGGIVKKAGNNMIVEIGKIQGKPLTIKPEQRKRDLDIYMSFPRSIEYQIKLKIPDGYTAEGVDALNKKVSNETGTFSVDANVKDQVINIWIKKNYLHAYETAANWNKILEFVDAASEWTNARILLKKN